MKCMMKNLMAALVPCMSVGLVLAQVPPASGGSVDGGAAPGQRRTELRQAVESQRQGRDAGVVGERRLSPEARAEMRQQLRQHGQAGREARSRP